MRSYQSYKLAQSYDSLVGDALLRETFEVFDKDHDGYLNAEDLRFRIFNHSLLFPWKIKKLICFLTDSDFTTAA